MKRVLPLRRGWTTGSCATAAAKAAWQGLLCGTIPEEVTISLPSGTSARFSILSSGRDSLKAWACVKKDAGDDPDITHGAVIRADVAPLVKGEGIRFYAGPGVGTITRAGLALAPGEPAINPTPRAMIRRALAEISHGEVDAAVTLSIKDGERLARKTLNARLGIHGGLSILGTTGIVVPFSCAAWVHTIHRGIDVARAANIEHIACSTGNMSERAISTYYGLDEIARIEMGDFVQGALNYLRRFPVPRVTIAGGIAKMTKLAQGKLDLRANQGIAHPQMLLDLAGPLKLSPSIIAAVRASHSIAEAFNIVQDPRLARIIVQSAARVATQALGNQRIQLDVAVVSRDARILGISGPFEENVPPIPDNLSL